MSQLARIRKAAVGTALGLGLGRILGGRLHVLPGPDSESASLVVEELRQAFGRSRLEFAVVIGERVRPNRKPVLQVMTDRGEVLGYAKVGWNGLTKRLVANEAEALRSMAVASPATFHVPRLLHEAEVADLRLIVVSPFPQNLLRRGALGRAAPYSAVHEVAVRGGTEHRTLVGSDYAATLRQRIASLSDADRRRSLTQLFERLESETGDRVMAFGSWHGDWTPWNMSRTRSGLFVWDWERSSWPVPIGLDVVHHRFQFRRRRGRETVMAAASAARSESSEMLLRLGVEESNHELLLRLYLLELGLRFEEGSGEGTAVEGESVVLEAALRTRISSA